MNAALLALISFASFIIAYRFYSRYIADKIFGLDPDFKTPAHEYFDGVDYVPCNKHVLFGHHYTSIAGAAPIVGPALAVIWGWLPALIWVIVGTIFMGAVHDFGCLVVSVKNKGKTIGDLTGIIISKRAKILFLVLVLCLTWLVLAVFGFVIASLFQAFPASVLPINFEIIIALIIGYLFYKKKWPILWPSIIALILLYISVYLGSQWITDKVFDEKNALGLGIGGLELWVILLLAYSFVASLLPVWTLLQPRDYINSHQLIVGLGLLYLAVMIYQPEVVAPVLRTEIGGGIPIFPFLFVTIACGAISGFHGLVGSGTTSKQLDKLPHARPIGYGATLGEGLLAVMAILACTAGFSDVGAWNEHYHEWGKVNKIGAFVTGGASFLENGAGTLGFSLPNGLATTLLAVIVISFAATTLDSACRIQRFIISELGESWNLKFLQNRVVGSGIAASTPLILVFMKTAPNAEGVSTPYWTKLWPIFGATNQMLAALSLLVLTLYLARKKKNYFVTFIPFLFIVGITATAMSINLKNFIAGENTLLIVITALLLSLSLWIIVEGIIVFLQIRRGEAEDNSLN